MSRRKQLFPVRIEGNRLHLSVEPGSSSIEKPKEPDSRTILLDESDLSISAEAALLTPPKILSDGELIATSPIHNESKTNVVACDEDSFLKSKAEPEVILSSVKVETSIAIHEEQDPLIISACNNSSCIAKEGDFCSFPVDEKEQYVGVTHEQKLKPLCHLHDQAHCDCAEVEKKIGICRDFNVRTSLVCKTGTEIKIIHNASAEKVEVQCVTNLTENTFGIHKKQIKGSLHKDNDSETKNQKQASRKKENHLESKESPALDAILPCVEVDISLLNEEPEPVIISPCADSITVIEETNLSTFPVGETEQCDRIVASPEPDSDTILLDEHDLNIPGEVVRARSPNVFSNGEFILTNAIYNESGTNVLTYDEQSFLKNETKPQLISPSLKIEPLEPSVILNEEQDSIIISDYNESPCIVQKEGFFAFPVHEQEQCESATVTQGLKPLCLSHEHAQCDCNEAEENAEICGDLNVSTPLIDECGTEAKTCQSLCTGKVEEQSVIRFTENTFTVRKKQLQKIRGSLHKNHALQIIEQSQACSDHENLLESEESPMQAILPCVDVDPSLLKEEPEPLIISPCQDSIPIIEETSISTFPVGKRVINVSELKPLCLSHNHAQCDCIEIEQNAEICGDLNVETLLIHKTETKPVRSLCARKRKLQRTRRSTGKTSKVRKKRFQKSRRSLHKNCALENVEQSQTCTDHENLKNEESSLQAILPCVDVDPSLLKEETETSIISSSKDSVPISAETSPFNFGAGERNQCESKNNTMHMCLRSNRVKHDCEVVEENIEISDDSSLSDFEFDIPGTKASRTLKPCVTDEEIRCMVDYTKEALDEREKKLQQIREAVYRKRALETDEQRQARLEKDKLRQRKRRAEETEEQREKRLLTMRLHKRIKRSMHSSPGLQKNFLDYYMEEMFKYPETQEDQGSPLNMIVSIDPSWVLRTVEKQQFKCAVETEDQRKTRLEKDMLRQRRKRAEETAEQRAKRLETMRINKRIRRAMETEEQRHRRLEYSRERQLFRRLNETEEQRKERLEREKLRQREKRASESSEERALRLQAARERMRMRLSVSGKVADMFDNLLSGDSLSS